MLRSSSPFGLVGTREEFYTMLRAAVMASGFLWLLRNRTPKSGTADQGEGSCFVGFPEHIRRPTVKLTPLKFDKRGSAWSP
jgi:hypothetical protein